MESYLIPVLVILLVILVVNVTGNLGSSARSLRRLERRLDLLLDHLGAAEPGTAGISPETLAEVDDLVAQGRTKDATRIYFEESGVDRGEARIWIRRRAETRGPA
ncbi:hypothetical protein [Myceligenerans indicum]|uniref:Ribosomal protein L7/L12 C-terminal domain-containing protein n=1 Tax=Myceligenerans indicum TaxID=2593663 RepID=A0ABS1LLH0_9MICO|nr:hypothetical protein [Myceligenerans indicum]MBL0887018.1 hypothetical protein [Myceligenerans indicum]